MNTTLHRRRCAQALAAAALAAWVPARAQAFPNKPIKLIVGFALGGANARATRS